MICEAAANGQRPAGGGVGRACMHAMHAGAVGAAVSRGGAAGKLAGGAAYLSACPARCACWDAGQRSAAHPHDWHAGAA